MDTERNPRRSLAFGLPASSRVILLANSRRGSTDRNLGKMEPVRRRKPGFQTLQTNSPAVSVLLMGGRPPVPIDWKAREIEGAGRPGPPDHQKCGRAQIPDDLTRGSQVRGI